MDSFTFFLHVEDAELLLCTDTIDVMVERTLQSPETCLIHVLIIPILFLQRLEARHDLRKRIVQYFPSISRLLLLLALSSVVQCIVPYLSLHRYYIHLINCSLCSDRNCHRRVKIILRAPA